MVVAFRAHPEVVLKLFSAGWGLAPRAFMPQTIRRRFLVLGLCQYPFLYTFKPAHTAETNVCFLGKGDRFIEINVLNGVEYLDSIVQWLLEGFSSGDKTATTGAFIDDCCLDSLGQIILSRWAA